MPKRKQAAVEASEKPADTVISETQPPAPSQASTPAKLNKLPKTTHEPTSNHGSGAEGVMEKLRATHNFINGQLPKGWSPSVAIICGSGLGGLVSLLKPLPNYAEPISFPYSSIPHFPTSTVQGHAGKLVFGQLEFGATSVGVVCMVGRFHFYEGHPLSSTVYPVRLFKLLGVKTLIVTNAAGSLNHRKCKVGDVVMIKDHINMLGLAGQNPLVGPNLDEFGPRFPPTSDAYSHRLRKLTRQAYEMITANNKNADIPALKSGVYVYVAGPSYETPSEAKFLYRVGGDVVGMSTVPEVITARHEGIQVLGLSLVTNYVVLPENLSDDSDEEPSPRKNGSEKKKVPHASHEEVLEMSNKRAVFMQELVTKTIQLLSIVN